MLDPPEMARVAFCFAKNGSNWLKSIPQDYSKGYHSPLMEQTNK